MKEATRAAFIKINGFGSRNVPPQKNFFNKADSIFVASGTFFAALAEKII